MNFLSFIVLVSIMLMQPVLGTTQMDGSMNVFYIHHYHPQLQEGINTMGKTVVQNNNPSGFTVTVSSQNQGKLVPDSFDDGESYIYYETDFEAGSGHIGDGIITDYSTSNLVTPPSVIDRIISAIVYRCGHYPQNHL